MADMYEKRSGKATRQKHEKDRRDKVVQVRMSDAELSLLDERRGTRSRSNFLRGALYGNRHAPQSEFRDSVDKLRAEVEGLRSDLQAYAETGGDV